jgi:serine/threonine protein kinase
MRLQIAIDVASALEYLHQSKPLPIIHCDLKPSNVLLDRDMVAHVGDFGLARFLHQDSDKSSGWASMRGTIGYAAPGVLLFATDLYSLIVVVVVVCSTIEIEL